ncbi:MAG: ABC transporter ATP-binding protein [Acidobacteria bacterium]|nr:ABC transporter ATP-binding protein [Acidobacteriota bacterium]
MTHSPIIRAKGLTRTYEGHGRRVAVFEDLDLEIRRGELVAVVGASGVGKSTLLHLLGGLDRPTAGSLEVDGIDLAGLTEPELCQFRNRRIGFVFQFHHLLPEFSALENVMMPMLISGYDRHSAGTKARELLGRVGLGTRIDHRPGELSGGEQQRTALARALVLAPALLLADEPTGNLDQQTGDEVLALLLRLRAGNDLTAVIVTHNERLAAAADRVLRMEHRTIHPDSVDDGT